MRNKKLMLIACLVLAAMFVGSMTAIAQTSHKNKLYKRRAYYEDKLRYGGNYAPAYYQRLLNKVNEHIRRHERRGW